MMKIRYAGEAEQAFLAEHDRHLSGEAIRQKIERGEMIVMYEQGQPAGWLRFNLFWDEIPFMNMLFVLEEWRGKGCARALIEFWEEQMRAGGHRWVMTSTMSSEQAQHLYRKLGYRDCGALLLPEEPAELILMKTL